MKALSYSIVFLVALSCPKISAFSRQPTAPRKKQVPLARHPRLSPARLAKKAPVSSPVESEVGPPQASPLVKLASSPIGALVVLAGVVLFHESGHWLTAGPLVFTRRSSALDLAQSCLDSRLSVMSSVYEPCYLVATADFLQFYFRSCRWSSD